MHFLPTETQVLDSVVFVTNNLSYIKIRPVEGSTSVITDLNSTKKDFYIDDCIEAVSCTLGELADLVNFTTLFHHPSNSLELSNKKT